MKRMQIFSPDGTMFIVEYGNFAPLARPFIQTDHLAIHRNNGPGMRIFAEEIENKNPHRNMNIRNEIESHRSNYEFVLNKFKKLKVFL